MRTVLLTLVVAGATLHAPSAQVRYGERDFQAYYNWFQSVTPTDALQENGAELFIFTPATPLRSTPCQTAPVLTRLPIGTSVINRVAYVHETIVDEIDGYADRWFRVRYVSGEQGWQEGYVWGAHIARAWTWARLPTQQSPALVMLGIGGDPIQRVSDMQGEIRIAHDQRLLHRQRIEKMCLFRECYSSALLRVLPDQPRTGQLLIEATSLISNCAGSSIDKAFFAWTENGLRSVYHGEYTTGHTYSHAPLRLGTEQAGQLECRYNGEDRYFNPIWSCATVTKSAEQPTKIIRAR